MDSFDKDPYINVGGPPDEEGSPPDEDGSPPDEEGSPSDRVGSPLSQEGPTFMDEPLPPAPGFPSSPGWLSLRERFGRVMEELLPNFPEYSYVLAFSGGADSLALLLLCLGFIHKDKLISFTLDHSIRDNSEEETQKALKIAEALGVKALSMRVDIPKLSKERGKGLEDAGRLSRYEELEKIRVSNGFDYILTGHQADDLAETILGKLIRGGGPGAFASLKERNGKILRPLLSFEGKELRDILKENGIAYLLDETNEDLKYTRNLIRKRLMPEIIAINPKIKDALIRLSSISSLEEAFWEDRLDQISEDLVLIRQTDAGTIYLIEEEPFQKLHPAERGRLVGRLLRRVPLPLPGGGEPPSLKSVTMALGFIDSRERGGLDLPGGRRVERLGTIISLGPASRLRARHSQKP